jgi:Fe(3+) dicitrate transport protein
MTYSGLTLAEFTANPRFNPFRNDFFYGDRWGGSALYTNAINSRAVFTTALYGANFKRDWWRQSSNSDQRPNRRGNNGCNGLAELNTLCGNEGRLRSYDSFGIDPRLKVSSRAGETDFGFRYHRETQDRIQLNNNTLGPNGRGGATVEDNGRGNSPWLVTCSTASCSDGWRSRRACASSASTSNARTNSSRPTSRAKPT